MVIIINLFTIQPKTLNNNHFKVLNYVQLHICTETYFQQIYIHNDTYWQSPKFRPIKLNELTIWFPSWYLLSCKIEIPIILKLNTDDAEVHKECRSL